MQRTYQIMCTLGLNYRTGVFNDFELFTLAPYTTDKGPRDMPTEMMDHLNSIIRYQPKDEPPRLYIFVVGNILQSPVAVFTPMGFVLEEDPELEFNTVQEFEAWIEHGMNPREFERAVHERCGVDSFSGGMMEYIQRSSEKEEEDVEVCVSTLTIT
jgi:hypothetical protein